MAGDIELARQIFTEGGDVGAALRDEDARSEEHTSELQSHSDLPSFPTRRSSDLIPPSAICCAFDGSTQPVSDSFWGKVSSSVASSGTNSRIFPARWLVT